LALFHDLQIVTIAYDHQVAGVKPETPTVVGLLCQSWTMGILMFVQTMGLVAYGHKFLSGDYEEAYKITMSADNAGQEMARYMESAVFLQISNSSAILILSARTLGFFFTTVPAWQLLFSTAIGQVLINLWVFHPPGTLIQKLQPFDVAAIWVYDILWLLLLDIVKMTAGAIWEKVKSPEIDKNPALLAQTKRRKRVSNNLQPGYVAVQASGAGPDPDEDTQQRKKRISQKMEAN